METTSIIQPHLTVLNDGQKKKVHSSSLEILSSVGVRIQSEQALEIFTRALGSRLVQDDVVRIPGEFVEEGLKGTSSSIDIFNRKGDHAFHLPGDTRFGIGVTTLYYQDPETDKVAPFTRQHMETGVRLGERLSSFDAISTLGVIQNVPVEVSDLYAALEMIANTIKPLVILISDEDAYPSVLDLLEHLHGDLTSKPFIIPYFNPITPLVINRGTVDKMLTTIQRGLPFIYSNAGMTGATTPITAAGTLALMNAELLAGLVLSQLIKEGTPIILGSLPSCLDMRRMEPATDPTRFLLNLACAEMMAHYNIPHFGTAGSSTGWGIDLITGGYQWLNHIVSCMGKVGLASFVGTNFHGMAFTPKLVVYANEVIEQARLFARGFALEDDLIGLNEITEAGPGGNFLTSNLTLKLFRHAYFQSEIFPQFNLEDWQTQGCPRADDILRRYTLDLIDKLEAPDDYEDMMERGESFIRRL